MSRQFTARLMSSWEEWISVINIPEIHFTSTPFQTSRWLDSWASTLANTQNVQLLPILVYQTGLKQPVMALPLILTIEAGMRKIEPLDLGLTDYNAPIITRNLNLSNAEAERLWAAVKTVLPPADMVLITKIPHYINSEPNPLCQLRQADKSPLNGNMLTVSGTWHDYHLNLERTFRKEIERSWRVFEKNLGAEFKIITAHDEANKIMDALERQQIARMAELEKDYILDKPEISAFYRDLLTQGLNDQSVRLTALLVGNEVVAALLGIAQTNIYAMVRLSTGDMRWRNCSPGRLLIYKTMEALHGEGFRHFDYTIGDYAYKRRMGTEFVPLCNFVEALSLKGLPTALKLRLRFRLQLSPTWKKLKSWKQTS